MIAYGALDRCLLADNDVSAVRALPNCVAIAGEYEVALYVRKKLAVSLLVMLLDLADLLKEECDAGEALFLRYASKLCVHIGPLVVLALSGVEKVYRCGGNLAVVKKLEPDLCVLLLVVCGLLKEVSDLNVALFSCLGCVVSLLVSCLRLACESGLKILLCS